MKISTHWKKLSITTILVFFAIYPFMHGDRYIMHVFIMFFMWAIIASAWNLMLGYAGIISMANLAFVCIGGYASGIFTKTYGLSPWFGILAGGVITMIVVTIVLALPALRLSGIYICLLTIVFIDAIPPLIVIAREHTGGSIGMRNIPPFWENIQRIEFYYISFLVFLLMLAVINWIIRSNSGLAFQALRDSEELAKSLGVNLLREKIIVFVITSFITGVIGGIYAHYLGTISSSVLSLENFMMAIAMIIVGGKGRFPGAVLGALILIVASEFFRLAGTFRMALIGGIICLSVFFFPQGIMQLVDWIDEKITKRKRLVSETKIP